MKQVQIIAGNYGMHTETGLIRLVEAGNTISLTDAEADRLISLGVAAPAVATPAKDEAEPKAGVTLPDPENAVEDEETAHLDEAQLMAMTAKQLEALAADMNVDVKKCKNKKEMVAAIVAASVFVDEDADGQPDLGGEAPAYERV